jgi:Lipase (class 3)
MIASREIPRPPAPAFHRHGDETMAYTPPTPDLTPYLRGTSLGQVWLGLSAVAYASETDKSKIVPAVQNAFKDPTLVPPPPDPTSGTGAALPGRWSLDWGPAVTTEDNANALYVASFRDPGDKPYFFAVAIRGTDTSVGIIPLFQQIFEDFGVFGPRDFSEVLKATTLLHPHGVPNPAKRDTSAVAGKIAPGTADGFRRMANLKAVCQGKSVTVAGAVLDLLATYPGTPLIVTGHSLGGCQTQVMAAYLSWQLGNAPGSTATPVYPNPIAPSTAGNKDFAAWYDSLFPYGNFWFNTLDIVPCGFCDLPHVEDLWGAYPWPAGSVNPDTKPPSPIPPGTTGPACPAFLKDLIDSLLGKYIEKCGYTRPSVGLRQLDGSLPTPQAIAKFLADQNPTGKPGDAMGGIAMLEWQHFLPCYHALIEQVAGVLPYPLIDTQAINATVNAQAASLATARPRPGNPIT